MKKKLLILLLVLAIVLTLGIVAIASDGEETEAETITISYMNDMDTTSDTTSLDTIAYENGKQTVVKGEEFTLPTTANSTYVGQEGYQLVWYTESGRTFKAGETVSFDKDTKLFRVAAKECYTMDEINIATTSNTQAAILMTNITTSTELSVVNQGRSTVILNGFTINSSRNGNFSSGMRSGKIILGEGTINFTHPNGKVGEYCVFNCQSHGWYNNNNIVVVGEDVTINAPNSYLVTDSAGYGADRYPWVRIYGKINTYALGRASNHSFGTLCVEIFDTADVTITGPFLYNDSSSTFVNNRNFDTRIYGGTFNLPAEATNESFWTFDNVEEITIGTTTYTNKGNTEIRQDNIKIFGGSFVLPDNAVPAIDAYLKNDYIGTFGGTGIVTNTNDSTYYVNYLHRPGIKLVFKKYTSTTPGTLTVTDYIDGTLSGTYKYTATTKTITYTNYKNASETATIIDTITVYEAREVTETAEDGTTTTTTVYDVVTDKFTLDYAGNSVLFSSKAMKQDMTLCSFEANNKVYQTVVPDNCEHSFTGAPVDATCEHRAYADYNCSVCAHNVYFSWGEKLEHTYAVGTHVQATTKSMGLKEYVCSICGSTKTYSYTLNPNNFEVSVTIRNDDGTFENVTVLASEIFEFTTVGDYEDTLIYTLTEIKAFGEYSIRNIYGITIPKGIMSVNITARNYEKYDNVEYGLVNLAFEGNTSVRIVNIGNLGFIEALTFGEDSEIIIQPSASWYSPNNERRSTSKLKTIDISAENLNINFMPSAFQDRPIAELKLGENSTYKFGNNSFKNCAILEFDFPTTSTYTFGDSCFYGNDMTELAFTDGFDMTFSNNMFNSSPNLTTVRFGKNAVYTIGGSQFSNCKMLESIDFATGSTYTIGSTAFYNCPLSIVKLQAGNTYIINSQAFINSNLTEVDLSAGNMTVTFKASAFNCWSSNKVYCNLTTLKLGENSTYSFEKESFNHSAIKNITIPSNTTCTFSEYAFNNNAVIETIDASAKKANATFYGNSFNGRTTLTSLLLGEDSVYRFDSSSFKNTSIKEIVIPSGATCTFNDGCFNGSTTLETIDASAINTTITFNSKCFNGIASLKSMLFGENATLTFSSECFKGTGITALGFGKGSTVIFNSGAFNNSSIAEMSFADDSDFTFNNGSFNYSIPCTELVFANNSKFLFKDWVFNTGTSIQKLDLSGNGTEATFNSNASRAAASLTTVLLNGNNSTYIINSEAFRYCSKLTTVDISGEDSSYTINNSNALSDIAITELVFGKNSIYNFGQWIVAGTTALQKIDASAEGVNVTFGQNSFRNESTMTELLINGKNATYVFISESFRGCSGIEALTLGDGSTYTFNQNCFLEANNFTSFDASASNITATIGKEVFSGKSKITYIAFGENSNYTFGNKAFYNTAPTNDVVFESSSMFSFDYQSFYGTDFNSITFEDGCDVTFIGIEAFKDCNKTTSLYIGKDIAITNYPFRNFKALEELYIMSGVTHANTYEFENAGSSDFSTPLYVYNHSLDFTFDDGTFNNCDGIILYTATNNIGTRTDVFRNCTDGTGYKAWTVYLGIPYPVMVQGEVDPSCEEYGYDTYFCACEHNCDFYLTETTVVNKYENKHNITDATEYAEQTTYEVTPIDPKGHDTLGTLLDVVYNSFVEKGTGTFVCSACGKTHTAENAVDAIFEWLGYSTDVDKTEFAIGYRINQDMLTQYETLSGNKLEYGIVGAITQALGDKAPLDETLDPSISVLTVALPRANENGNVAEVNFRIKGFTEKHYDLGMTMAGYVKETVTDEEGNETTSLVYIQSAQTDKPSSNTINTYLASLIEDDQE